MRESGDAARDLITRRQKCPARKGQSYCGSATKFAGHSSSPTVKIGYRFDQGSSVSPLY